jgi:thiamine biosynthesis lipoprotein
MEPVRRSFRAMNTSVNLIVYPTAELERGVAIDELVEAEGIVRRIEDRFSRFREDSELCQLNRSSGRWFSGSADLAEVLALARTLHAETGGIFDPVILGDLERVGYARSFEAIGEHLQVEPPSLPRHGFAEVEFGDVNRVRLPSGVRLDLGGIVKGWTADRLVDYLGTLGPALVDLGGDVAVRGVPPDSAGWSVGVECPDDATSLLAVIDVRSGGIATSGTNRRRWRQGDRWMHHLIDPRTGDPAQSDLVQVVALATSAARADVGAKTALILGTTGCQRLLPERPDLDFLLVPDDGAPLATTGARAAIPAVAG